MNKSSGTSSWIMLLVAVLSWIGVGFFVMMLFQMRSERSEYMVNAAQANLQEGQTAQLRVIARETEADRTELMSITGVDILSAVNTIEAVGTSAIPVRVTSAQSVKVNTKAASPLLNVADLQVTAEGSFSSLMRILQMIESLPLVTTVQEVDLTSATPENKNAKNGATTWTLNMRLRFYTTASLSS